MGENAADRYYEKNEILAIKISIKVMDYIKRFPKCDTS